jgi:hypothetical protein
MLMTDLMEDIKKKIKEKRQEIPRWQLEGESRKRAS